jgi:DNA-binding transcriptional LysR family regulator
MQLHEIRYFLATARELNFTRAARVCGVSQPALTRAIKKLEAELGGELLSRRPGHVELTRLGVTLLPKLEQIERDLMQVRSEAAATIGRGTAALKIGVMCTVSPVHIVNLLARLRKQQPNVRVTIYDAKASAVLDMLIDGHIDVGITAQPSFPESVAAVALHTETYVAAMPQGHPLTHAEQVRYVDLAREPYLERLGCEFDDYFEAQTESLDVDFDVHFSSEREDWIQALIQAGEGCAIVPESMACLVGVEKRQLCEPDIARTISLVVLRGRQLSSAAQDFVRLATQYSWARRSQTRARSEPSVT